MKEPIWTNAKTFLVVVVGVIAGNILWAQHKERVEKEQLIELTEQMEAAAKAEQANYEAEAKIQRAKYDEAIQKAFEEFKESTSNVRP